MKTKRGKQPTVVQKVIVETGAHVGSITQGAISHSYYEYLPQAPTPYLRHPYQNADKNFTGRVQETSQLTEWLSSEKDSTLVITGLGGTGKSVLTWIWLQTVVLIQKESLLDGIFFWSFYNEDAQFAAFVAEAVRYLTGKKVKSHNVSNNLQLLLSIFNEKRILMVLDGFERELVGYSLDKENNTYSMFESTNFRACANPKTAYFLHALTTLQTKSKILITSRHCPHEFEGKNNYALLELEGLHPKDAVVFMRAEGANGRDEELEKICESYECHPLTLRVLARMIAKDNSRPGDISIAMDYDPTYSIKQRKHHVLEIAYEVIPESLQNFLSQIATLRASINHETLHILFCTQSLKSRIEKFLSKNSLIQYTPVELSEALNELDDRGFIINDRYSKRVKLHPIVQSFAYEKLKGKQGIHNLLQNYYKPLADKVQPHQVETIKDLAPLVEYYFHLARSGDYGKARHLHETKIEPVLYYFFGDYQFQVMLVRELFPKGEHKPPQLSLIHRPWALNALANLYTRMGQLHRAVELRRRQIKNRWLTFFIPLSARGLTIGYSAIAKNQIDLGRLKNAKKSLFFQKIALYLLVCTLIVFTLTIHALLFLESQYSPFSILCYIVYMYHLYIIILKCLPVPTEYTRTRGEFEVILGNFEKANQYLERSINFAKKTNLPQSEGLSWLRKSLLEVKTKDYDKAYKSAERANNLLKHSKNDSGHIGSIDIVWVEWLLGESLIQSLVTLPIQTPEILTNNQVEYQNVSKKEKEASISNKKKILKEAETHFKKAIMHCRETNLVEIEPDILLSWAKLCYLKQDFTMMRNYLEEAIFLSEKCEYKLKLADIYNFMAYTFFSLGEYSKAYINAKIAYEYALCDGPPTYYKFAVDQATNLLSQIKTE